MFKILMVLLMIATSLVLDTPLKAETKKLSTTSYWTKSALAPTPCWDLISSSSGKKITTVCMTSTAHSTEITLTKEKTNWIYGLGSQFREPGQIEGDWNNQLRSLSNPYGASMDGYNGGAVENALFPIFYSIGDRDTQYAVWIETALPVKFDFSLNPYKITIPASLESTQWKWHVWTGETLKSLRSTFLSKSGLPKVLPKKAFGLWVSEFGFDNWEEMDDKVKTLKQNGFPLSGLVMDLQWFGGIKTNSEFSPMGGLNWDLKNFPNPAQKISQYAEQDIGIVTIEESYISKGLPEYSVLKQNGFLVKKGNANAEPVYLSSNPWWGLGGMIDWTSPQARLFWHNLKRQPLIEAGVMGHWTDLGEPEMYDAEGWYHGQDDFHDHASNHGLYNLSWAKGINEGYAQNSVEQRPWILSRSGSVGIQNYGVAMWSGDIGSNLKSLAAHMRVQSDMSLSGMDYYGSDVGGFHRGGLEGDLNEVYTKWFAHSSLIDIPLRPHTENLCNCKETAPDRIGDKASNLYNLKWRYKLIPYYYSLAFNAWQTGEAIIPPAYYEFPKVPALQAKNSHKMIGPFLLTKADPQLQKDTTDVFLPKGNWIDLRQNQIINSAGQWFKDISMKADGHFTLPLFMREGAIIPVQSESQNALHLWVYPSLQESHFTFYDDDGWSSRYLTQNAFSKRTITAIKNSTKGQLYSSIRISRDLNGFSSQSSAVTLSLFSELNQFPKRVLILGNEVGFQTRNLGSLLVVDIKPTELKPDLDTNIIIEY